LSSRFTPCQDEPKTNRQDFWMVAATATDHRGGRGRRRRNGIDKLKMESDLLW
jgi:hypothetical protein